MRLDARTASKLARLRRGVRNVNQQDSEQAVLGDENGNISAKRQPYLYYARFLDGENEDGSTQYGKAFTVLSGAGYGGPEKVGTAVYIGLAYDGQLGVLGTDREALLELDKNPRAENPNSPYNKFVYMRNADLFLAKPLGTTSDTGKKFEVRVEASPYISDEGEHVVFPGGKIDLESYIPAADGDGNNQHLICAVFVNASNELEAVASTAKLIDEVITWEGDVDEAFNARSARALPVRYYLLYTEITLLTEGDDFGDGRDWIAAPERKNNYTGTVKPEVTDDIDLRYEIGSLWIDIVGEQIYMCLDNTDGAADWETIGNLYDVTADPTGFTDPANIVSTYDSTARTITLTGTVKAYFKGEVVTELVSGWVSNPHDNTPGLWFLMFDDTGISWSDTVWKFYEGHIAFVSFGATHKWGLRNCHGLMDWTAHKQFHEVIGTYKTEGGDFSGYTLDSTTAAERRPLVSSPTIYDEDLMSALDALAAESYSWHWLTSTDTSNFAIAQTDIVSLSTNRPYWNEFTGGAWTQTLMANSSYMAIWLIAIPTTDDAVSKNYRFIWQQGQVNSTSLAVIQALAPPNVSLGEIAALALEFVFIGKAILKYSGANWTLEEFNKLEGTRFLQTLSPGSGLSTVSTDATLTGSGTAGDPLAVVDDYVDIDGDIMTGLLEIQVPTATTEALILKTTDDDATKKLLAAFKADGTTYLISLTAGGRLGIGTGNPNAPLEVKGLYPGTVGGFPSGLLHVITADNSEFANSVITGHNFYTGNTQLWYLGSTSNSNNDIALINRQDGSLSLWTDNILRLMIDNLGNILVYNNLEIQGTLELASGTTVNEIDTAMDASPTDDQLLTAQAISEAILAGGGGVTGTVLLPFNARLTLETGVAVSTTSQPNKQEIFLTPCKGNRLALYNGTTWDTHELGSDISVKLTDVQDGDTHNGTAIIDNMTNTSQLIEGMLVTGTGVGLFAQISSIDSATQITVDQNSTADGTVAILSKVVKGTVVDIFVVDDGGLALRMVAWASSTARATAIVQVDGIDVLTGSTGWRLAGSILVSTSTNGVTFDSGVYTTTFPARNVSNRYNRVLRFFSIIDTTDSWVYAVATLRPWNNDVNNKVEFCNCVDDDPVYCNFIFGAGANFLAGAIDVDGTTAKDNYIGGFTGYGTTGAILSRHVGIGRHKLTLLEYAGAAITVYGDANLPNTVQCGATGWIWG